LELLKDSHQQQKSPTQDQTTSWQGDNNSHKTRNTANNNTANQNGKYIKASENLQQKHNTTTQWH
jgi:hypothetical protein